MDKTNKLQQAIALTYEVGESAPKVVAKGRGVIAQRIIEESKAHNVFVHESKELVALLMRVNLDEQIPPALYTAIAEILAWVYRLENGISENETVNPSNCLITL
jgi:flagellar biosynthesis protein